MPEAADLFVVCHSCGAEVSKYVTECPYCGERVQKRAPKIARGQIAAGGPKPKRQRRVRRSRDSSRFTTQSQVVAVVLAAA